MTSTHYPSQKILMSYAFFGGIVGGLVFCLGVGMFLGFEQLTQQTFRTDFNALKDLIVGFSITMLASWLIGLIPAFLTGLILTETRTHWQILRPFIIGALVTFILSMLVSNFGFGFDTRSHILLGNLKISSLLALMGGLSSVIVGKFVLPKEVK